MCIRDRSGVRDASESDEVVIVGRHTMTDKIVDALTGNNTYALFTPETNEQLLRTGVQGSYRRARIITLPNVVDAYKMCIRDSYRVLPYKKSRDCYCMVF